MPWSGLEPLGSGFRICAILGFPWPVLHSVVEATWRHEFATDMRVAVVRAQRRATIGATTELDDAEARGARRSGNRTGKRRPPGLLGGGLGVGCRLDAGVQTDATVHRPIYLVPGDALALTLAPVCFSSTLTSIDGGATSPPKERPMPSRKAGFEVHTNARPSRAKMPATTAVNTAMGAAPTLPKPLVKVGIRQWR